MCHKGTKMIAFYKAEKRYSRISHIWDVKASKRRKNHHMLGWHKMLSESI